MVALSKGLVLRGRIKTLKIGDLFGKKDKSVDRLVNRLIASVTTNNTAELGDTIAKLRIVISETPPEVSSLDAPVALACGLLCRYYTTQDRSDLTEAISNWDEVVKVPQQDASDLPRRLSISGNSCLEQSQYTGLIDVEAAISNYRQATALESISAMDLRYNLNALSLLLTQYYESTNDLANLYEAITCRERALSMAQLFDVADLRSRSPMAAMGMPRHPIVTLADLEAAVLFRGRSPELAAPDSLFQNPFLDLSEMYYTLNKALFEKYKHTRDITYIDQIISTREALSKVTKNSRSLPYWELSIGESLRNRYDYAGDPEDLDAAISILNEALKSVTAEFPDITDIRTRLATVLGMRYDLVGDPEDLEAAFSLLDEALKSVQPGSPQVPWIQQIMASTLLSRFAAIGNERDLDAAISHSESAVKLSDEGSDQLALRLSSLGDVLMMQYERTHDLNVLNEAISQYKKSLELTSADDPRMPTELHRLGYMAEKRYDRTQDLNDLKNASSYLSRALDITPENSPEMPVRIYNVGRIKLGQYRRTQEASDLEDAISKDREAVRIIPADAPHGSDAREQLAWALRERYLTTHDAADIREAFSVLREAVKGSDRVFSAVSVDYKLGERRHKGRVDYEMVSVALQLAGLQQPDQRLECFKEALLCAEGAKSRILTELLGRESIPAPPSVPQDLVEKEANLVKKLIQMDNQDLAAAGAQHITRAGTSLTAQGLSTSEPKRAALRKEWVTALERVWDAMEKCPNATEFVALRRGSKPTWSELSQLAEDAGNETIFTSTVTFSDQMVFFFIRSGWKAPKVASVPFDRTRQQFLLRQFEREVCRYDPTTGRRETWQHLIAPLLDEIGKHLKDVKRVVFSPDGFGYLIPWSAALQEEDGRDLSWIVTPSFGSAIRLLERRAIDQKDTLIVGNPKGDLPDAEGEANDVAKLLKSEPPLIGPAATKEEVQRRLPTARIAHFATHAYFDPINPLNSGIVLADGILTAREIMGLEISPDLLTLSACETGMTATLGGNEMAGITQAFLQAGATSLLVSLWRVNDPASAALMGRFYACIHQGCNRADALKKAMEYIRLDTSWKHTYYWGAFTLVGNWQGGRECTG